MMININICNHHNGTDLCFFAIFIPVTSLLIFCPVTSISIVSSIITVLIWGHVIFLFGFGCLAMIIRFLVFLMSHYTPPLNSSAWSPFHAQQYHQYPSSIPSTESTTPAPLLSSLYTHRFHRIRLWAWVHFICCSCRRGSPTSWISSRFSAEIIQ